MGNPNLSIDPNQLLPFIDEFLAEFLSNRIGTKSKGEIDILMMNLLINYASLQSLSNQDLGILLKAPVSSIKKLRYKARLKFPPPDQYVRDILLLTLLKAQFVADKSIIAFVLEDEYVRHTVNGKLKERGCFSDSSYNSEIVKID